MRPRAPAGAKRGLSGLLAMHSTPQNSARERSGTAIAGPVVPACPTSSASASCWCPRGCEYGSMSSRTRPANTVAGSRIAPSNDTSDSPVAAATRNVPSCGLISSTVDFSASDTRADSGQDQVQRVTRRRRRMAAESSAAAVIHAARVLAPARSLAFSMANPLIAASASTSCSSSSLNAPPLVCKIEIAEHFAAHSHGYAEERVHRRMILRKARRAGVVAYL